MLNESDFEKMLDDIFQSLQNAEIAKQEAYQHLSKVYGERFLRYLKKRKLNLG